MGFTLGTWARRALEEGEIVEGPGTSMSVRVVRFIGRGGMGEVYEAVDDRTGTPYAVKCLQLAKVQDPKICERTRREGIVLQRLRHRHVVKVHAMGVRSDGLIWMVMELLAGFGVDELLATQSRLPIAVAVEIARDLCRGLAAVHEFAVHRDIKPANVHLGLDGIVRVLDLGAGKLYHHGLLTTEGFSLGTVPYMSPEQLIEPDKVDRKSDLFSVGVLLFQMLSGVHPFDADGKFAGNAVETGHQIISSAPKPLTEVASWVPEYLVEVVSKSLQKEPQLRARSADEMAKVLSAVLRRYEHDSGPQPSLVDFATRLAEAREAAANARSAAPTPSVSFAPPLHTEEMATQLFRVRRSAPRSDEPDETEPRPSRRFGAWPVYLPPDEPSREPRPRGPVASIGRIRLSDVASERAIKLVVFVVSFAAAALSCLWLLGRPEGEATQISSTTLPPHLTLRQPPEPDAGAPPPPHAASAVALPSAPSSSAAPSAATKPTGSAPAPSAPSPRRTPPKPRAPPALTGDPF